MRKEIQVEEKEGCLLEELHSAFAAFQYVMNHSRVQNKEFS